MKSKKLVEYEDILQVVQRISRIFKENNIDYLIGGSFAYKVLTGDQDIQIHDLDIIVNEANFDKIVNILSKFPDDFVPIQTPVNIHVNHAYLMGSDTKPFDISLDSFEHYYEFLGVTMNDFKGVSFDTGQVQIMKVETLIKVYKYVAENKNPDKKEENLRKLAKLQNIGL